MYSNAISVLQKPATMPLTIMPNPAKDYVIIKFVVEKEMAVTIRLLDNTGKTVLQHNQMALKGTNSVQINNLGKYSKGVYSIQVYTSNDVQTEKLILAK
jgi:hypothetical protein